MQVLVVDDEPLARDRLIRFLQDMDEVTGMAVAHNGFDALEKLQTQSFDVVLLDIRMPGQSGLEVAEQLRKLPQAPAIIFCTAYDDYALDAFRVKAQAYLLKPIQRLALVEAMADCRRLNRAHLVALTGQGQIPSIAVQTGREKERLPLSDVYYFRAEQKYVSLFSCRGERIIDDSLKILEDRYPDHLIRVHRNTLVYRPRVEKLTRDREGGFWLTVQGVSELLLVSRRHAKAIKQLLDGGGQ
ncbi:LytTR family DNA-binding domain-containing protein [Reinekea sp.]|uniref:LytR/AlgR family response regulator transcription factor n=1 Tax=Reinekea sp. TaxID=1970455 RepID=UPI002A817080|nr:LytTR family DNA-binding domain-containing protein [Reinekea sp.]